MVFEAIQEHRYNDEVVLSDVHWTYDSVDMKDFWLLSV
jgi:hypothetical protein